MVKNFNPNTPLKKRLPVKCELTSLGIVSLKNAQERAANYRADDGSFLVYFVQEFNKKRGARFERRALLVKYTPLSTKQ